MINKTITTCALVSALFLPTPSFAQTYLQAKGKNIVTEGGESYTVRAMGIGGWMVMEPYLLGLDEKADEGQHKIFSDIERTVGKENLKLFRKAWIKNFFQEQDLIEMKRSGFNSVRLPLHYNILTLPISEERIAGQNTWLEEGFMLIDKVLEWSKKHEMYLFLDLHAAPGGQGRNGNINDYDPNKPSLWESKDNQQKTLALWQKIAQRYAHEPWIGGYELLNEPNWTFENGETKGGCNDKLNAPLKALYERLIAAVRQYDKKHLIFIQGNCWGNNHNGLWPMAGQSKNVVLSFHRYFSENNRQSIQAYLDLSQQHNIPLWMSESGENNSDWYSESVSLLEGHNIGWAWWTWKKVNHKSGAYSISPPTDYELLSQYWFEGGSKPDKTVSMDILMKLADNALLSNANRNDTAIDSLMVYKDLPHPPQPEDFLNVLIQREQARRKAILARPLIHHSVPGLIEAEDFYHMEGVQVESCLEGGENLGFLTNGDWMSYGITVANSADFIVNYRVASPNGGGKLAFVKQSNKPFINDHIYGIIDLGITGGWQNWQTFSHTVHLERGKHIIVLKVVSEGFNLNHISIEPPATD